MSRRRGAEDPQPVFGAARMTADRRTGRLRASAPPVPEDSTMQPHSADELITLLIQCDESSEEDRDKLLRDLLVHVYPKRRNQDN
jgi:hypothetical protein